MFTGVDSEMKLWRLDCDEGKPSRNEATAFPSVVLPMPPFDDVMSLSKSKKPAGLPKAWKSRPILRKSPPAFTVWVPMNFEYDALALVDFQSRSVGGIAPSVCAAFLS